MRLFTAIEIPAEIKQRLRELVEKLRPAAKLSWSPVDNLHVTTKFIGEWPEPRLAEVKDALAAVRKSAEFELAVRGLGWFPNARNPKVFWAGIVAQALVPASSPYRTSVETPGTGPNPGSLDTAGISACATFLQRLAQDTDNALTPLGVPVENREYHPHLTLARRRNPVPIDALRRIVEELPAPDFGSFRASSFFLYLSAGGKYTKLQEYPFVS